MSNESNERPKDCCCPPLGHTGIWAAAMCPVHFGLRALTAPKKQPVVPVAESIAGMVTEWVEGGIKMNTDWRAGLPGIIARRLARFAPIPPQPDHSAQLIAVPASLLVGFDELGVDDYQGWAHTVADAMRSAQRFNTVKSDHSAQDIQRDRSYRDGLMKGYGFGIANDEDGYQRSVNAYQLDIVAASKARTLDTVQGEFGEPYQGAREELSIWKRRALEAEKEIRKQNQIILNLGDALNAENGPTYMGEPSVQGDAQAVVSRTAKDYAVEHAEYMAKAADHVMSEFQTYGLALIAVDEGGDDGEGEMFEAIDSARSDLQEALVDLRSMVFEFRKRSARAITKP